MLENKWKCNELSLSIVSMSKKDIFYWKILITVFIKDSEINKMITSIGVELT